MRESLFFGQGSSDQREANQSCSSGSSLWLRPLAALYYKCVRACLSGKDLATNGKRNQSCSSGSSLWLRPLAALYYKCVRACLSGKDLATNGKRNQSCSSGSSLWLRPLAALYYKCVRACLSGKDLATNGKRNQSCSSGSSLWLRPVAALCSRDSQDASTVDLWFTIHSVSLSLCKAVLESLQFVPFFPTLHALKQQISWPPRTPIMHRNT